MGILVNCFLIFKKVSMPKLSGRERSESTTSIERCCISWMPSSRRSLVNIFSIARLEEDNISDKNIDVTRSERQQAAKGADQDRNIAMTEGQRGDDTQERSMNQTGGHQEGMYDKQSSKPMVDKDGAGAIDK